MEDGEYRANFKTTWVAIFPFLVFVAIGVWALANPPKNPIPPAGLYVCIAIMIVFTAMAVLGVWAYLTESLALTTDTLGYTHIGKPHWRVRWQDIRQVELRHNAGSQTISYRVILHCTDGTRQIDTTFLPVYGPKLADEICRRSGAPKV